MAYDRDEIFKAIGKSIARYNELTSMIADLETINEEHVLVLNESEYTRDMLDNVMRQRQTDKSRLTSSKTDTVNTVSRYLQDGVAKMLDVVLQGADNPVQKVLDALEDAMYLAGDSVECNTIPPAEEPAPGAPDTKADIDNQGVGKMTLGFTYDQQVHDELTFELECYDDATPGSELWRVKCDKESDLGTAQTGIAFTAAQEKYGLTFLISRLTAIEEGADPTASFSNFVLNGAVKRRGNEYSVATVGRSNSDFYGVYYYTLTDIGGGNRQVDVYLDLAHTIKVATGTRAGNGTVILAAVGGSGLTGSVDIVYTVDTSTSIKYPFQYKRDDRYYFTSTVAAAKLFQTFFVEVFDRALPCDDPATVDEDWAKWGLP